jgi:effector-binding domain-containing protein
VQEVFAMADIELSRTVTRPTAVVRKTVSISELPRFLAYAFGAVTGALTRQSIHVTGPPLAVYRMRHGDTFDVEAGFPVAAAVTCDGDVGPGILPGGEAVETVHTGPYETLADTYRQLADWIERHGRRPADLSWECYLTDPDDPNHPGGPQTLIVWPVRANGHRRYRVE